jgi:2-hydroxychromene-2-carboxylate isomerase
LHEFLGVRNVVLGVTMWANDTIDFWFTVGSTYTYLTVSRLNEIETASGIRF